MTKEGDGSKSSYIAHIGGFFTFVALAGLSLIGWGLNHHCWSKKSCCFKDYHNPLNIRVFWWLSFMGFCGVFACCISGFVTSRNFSNKVETTKCVYERIYYDSIYGEINKNHKENIHWEGVNNKEIIIEKFREFLIKDKYDCSFNFKFDEEEWKKGGDCVDDDDVHVPFLDSEVYYPNNFIEKLKQEILEKCKRFQGYSAALMEENGELICDSAFENKNSKLYKYINEITRITKYFSDEVSLIEGFVGEEPDEKTKKDREKIINNTLIIIEKNLNDISSDLDNYKNGFLDEADYYIKVSNKCGYILVTIYYSILLVVVVCSCFLLWAYSYFKEQRLIYTFMHISWNILKFFSFSFFMFGAAFGALYLVSRDLIGYNQFLFSDLNLAPNVTTYLLPNEAAKEFLRYCINEEDNNYINTNKFKIPTIVLLKDLYYNMKIAGEIIDKYDWDELKKDKHCYYVISENLRNIQEDADSTDGLDEMITLNFKEVGEAVEDMIKKVYQELYSSNLRRLEGENTIISKIKELGETIEKLNCGFLKTEIQILYDSLYELSIESRISCALCCCIGFFIEFSIAFYLLVLYHYNNTEFRDDNDTQKSFPKNRNRKFDLDSQNEFMDKSRPPNLKKNNKKLDLEFNFN